MSQPQVQVGQVWVGDGACRWQVGRVIPYIEATCLVQHPHLDGRCRAFAADTLTNGRALEVKADPGVITGHVFTQQTPKALICDACHAVVDPTVPRVVAGAAICPKPFAGWVMPGAPKELNIPKVFQTGARQKQQANNAPLPWQYSPAHPAGTTWHEVRPCGGCGVRVIDAERCAACARSAVDYSSTHTMNPYFVRSDINGKKVPACQDCGWYPGLDNVACSSPGTRYAMDDREEDLYRRFRCHQPVPRETLPEYRGLATGIRGAACTYGLGRR